MLNISRLEKDRELRFPYSSHLIVKSAQIYVA